jgi:hypothetical protein
MTQFRILLALIAVGVLAAASFEEMQAKTDMSSPEAVFALGQWCSDNNLPSRARQLYGQVIKIDRDHEGARAALGMIRVGDRWINKSDEKALPKPPARPAADPPPRPAGGSGPAVKDVAWNVTAPDDIPGDHPFIDGYLARMSNAPNDSDEMGRCIATLLAPAQWPAARPRLCRALLTPGFDDIYGAVEIAMELRKQGRISESNALLPFVAKASERNTNPEDLCNFILLASAVRDRRSLPRLIELFVHPEPGVRDAAAEAISAITHIPTKGLTPEQAKSWWDANWSKSEERILAEQLRGFDPMAAVCAAAELCERRDKAIFPVLFKLLRHEDPAINRRAIAVVLRATGLEFGYVFELPPVERHKKVDGIEKWWKQEKAQFSWPGLPKEIAPVVAGGPAVVVTEDPDQVAVRQLVSTIGTEAQAAELQLRGRGPKAVPALIEGLGDQSVLVRLRAYGILRETTRQTLAFDPNGAEVDRSKQVDAWRAWAIKQGLLILKPEAEPEQP